MRYSKFLSSLVLILTVFSLVIPSVGITMPGLSFEEETTQEELPWESLHSGHLISYDSILHVLKKIENEDWEVACTLEEIEKVSQFISLLSRQGIIFGETDIEQLEEDIAEMQNFQSSSYEYSYDLYRENEYEVIPSLYHYSDKGQIILCKSFTKKIKKFVKKHKKAIIIGAAVIVAAATVVGIAAIVSAEAAAAVATEAVAAGASAGAGTAKAISNKEESQESSICTITPTTLSSDSQSIFHEQISAFKELALEQGLISANDFNFPQEELGRSLGQVLTHQALDNLGTQPSPFSHHLLADKAFHPSDGTRPDLISALQTDPIVDIHQLRGERALELHCYDQAIFDFGKIIEHNPYNQEAYLERATAYFHKGNYQSSLEDYHTYIENKGSTPTQVIDFSFGFAKGLAKGAKESGAELASFASEMLRHPIDTGRSIWEACSILCELARTKEWETIGQAFSPDMHELITKWDILSSQQRGELAGKAFGKAGSDIVIPGGSAKIACALGRKARGALAAIRTLKNAEKTFVLEALAQSASHPQYFSETTTYLRSAESAALSSEEMSALSKSKEMLSGQAKFESFKLIAENGWILPEKGGAQINGRWYTEHALERMAPNTPQVMAKLEARVLERAKSLGLEPGTEKFGEWMRFNGPKPRGIPPSIVEAEIANPGSTPIRVILNEFGDVITVINGGK